MKKVLLILTAFFLVVIQTSMSSSVEIIGVAPNLIFIFAIVFGLNSSTHTATATGCLCGIISDCCDYGTIGCSALVLMYVTFLSNLASKKFYYDNKLVGIVIVFVSGLLFESVRLFISNLMFSNASFVTVFFRYILPEAVFNSVVAFPLMWWIKWLKNEYIRGI